MNTTAAKDRAAEKTDRTRVLLLLLLGLGLGVQLTLLTGYYLVVAPAVAAVRSTVDQLGSKQRDPSTRQRPSSTPSSQRGFMLTSCGTEELAEAVAAVRPSVVYITGHPLSTTTTAGSLAGDKMGSGVIIDPRGYILTNHHVVGTMSDVRVSVFGDRDRVYPAQIVVADEAADLAVIKIAAAYELPVAKLGNSDMLEAADEVLAIGCPFNLEQSVSHGVISDVKRTVVIEGRTYRDLIQTDAAINSGNSGGALISKAGEVVGINVAIYAPNSVYCGVGFAVPINRAKLLLMKVRYLSLS
jgi:serine protease Do